MKKRRWLPKEHKLKKGSPQRDAHMSNDYVFHITAFEVKLAGFLEKQCSASGMTLANLKDIIWNSRDGNLVARVVFHVAEENPRTKIDDILNIFMQAWNNFPHHELNGLSPREMTERLNADPNFIADNRPDFYTLYADRLPQEIKVVQQHEHEWSWEYPAAFQTRRAALAAFRSKDQDFIEERNDDGDEAAYEMLHDVTLLAAKSALDENPLQLDAATILARNAFETGDSRNALQILESTISSAREIFPPTFALGTDRLPWGFEDNRPFLFLLGEYATLTDTIHGPKRAIPHYEELLALNPNDNQGIREILATAYLKVGDLEDLLALDAQYPDDLMPGLKVGALLALYKLGRTDEMRNRIKKMKKYFSHIFREVLKTEHPRPELHPNRVLVGGDDEAWLYWETQGTFWMTTPGAREFLKKQMEQK